MCGSEQILHCTPLCKFTTKKSNALTIWQKNDAVLNGNNKLSGIIGTIYHFPVGECDVKGWYP